jgi:ascorbate-specific PTS system EIIC-type component UlaA
MCLVIPVLVACAVVGGIAGRFSNFKGKRSSAILGSALIGFIVEAGVLAVGSAIGLFILYRTNHQ